MSFFCRTFLVLILALASLNAATPLLKDRAYIEERDGVTYNVFEHRETQATMAFVNNSGVCETTAGVNQYSGYLSVGDNMNMWFWFFEARNNASTAPLVTWFNGGPGCSSMIGLFQENGPCQFYNGSSEPSLNPYSFNEYANMLYVDQPIGTGFSYGTDTVNSAASAAPFVWKLLQAFYAQFPTYESRDFGLFTESYGGMYGPAFTSYFESQNAAGAGEKINLIALGINNGWTDSIYGYKAQIDYLHNNSWRNIIDDSTYNKYISTYNADCLPALKQCQSSGTNSVCENALEVCQNEIEGPLEQEGDFNAYDVRASADDPNPPETYATYLNQAAIRTKIGAKVQYQECPNAPYQKFVATGDDSRTYTANLSSVVSSGVQTLLWAGDADWICNYYGVENVANSVVYDGQAEFKSKALAPYTVNGKQAGEYKTVGKLSYLRVTAAGHEVPYYQPELALQVFVQTMQQKAISST